MNTAAIVVLLYGIFSAIGGIIGYTKAGSTPSLYAGLISGAVFLICAYGLNRGQIWAGIIAAVLSLVLGMRFLVTISKNFKVMPDLIMILFSLAAILSVGIFLFKK
jgi:uncharacterized membrane protein (UPF0136 family)